MRKIVSIHQPETFPWAGYFSKMMNSDLFVVMDDVQYKKNNFQNRNRIMMNERSTWLTLPVDTKGRLESTIADTKIADTVNWKDRTLHLLEVAYSKCPYYGIVMSSLDPIIELSSNSLIAFNMEVIEFVRDYLNITTEIIFSSDLDLSSHKSDLVFDICESCNATTYLSGEGGRDYLGLDKFMEANIGVLYQSFDTTKTYDQNSKEFVPYMSIIDIIMNNSVPDTLKYLDKAFSFVK